jgi:hypothetical protein
MSIPFRFTMTIQRVFVLFGSAFSAFLYSVVSLTEAVGLVWLARDWSRQQDDDEFHRDHPETKDKDLPERETIRTTSNGTSSSSSQNSKRHRPFLGFLWFQSAHSTPRYSSGGFLYSFYKFICCSGCFAGWQPAFLIWQRLRIYHSHVCKVIRLIGRGFTETFQRLRQRDYQDNDKSTSPLLHVLFVTSL